MKNLFNSIRKKFTHLPHLHFWIGVLFGAGGILYGVFFGIYVMFIGGIVQVVDAVKAPHTDSMEIAVGLAKVVLAGPAGGFIAFLGIVIGSIFGFNMPMGRFRGRR